jgi:hypothetical protein
MKKLILSACMTLACASVFSQTQRHIVVFEISDRHVTLDLWEHVKDAANASIMEVPVDKKFYDSVNAGQKLDKSFRGGSFLLRGTWGERVVRVKSKRISVEK